MTAMHALELSRLVAVSSPVMAASSLLHNFTIFCCRISYNGYANAPLFSSGTEWKL